MLKKLLPVQLVLFYLFITSGLLVNLLQLLSLVLWPLNKKLYRSINRHLAYAFWSDLTALAQYWSNSDVVIYMSDEDWKYLNREHIICIMNHKYDIDWLMGWVVCQRTGLLGVSCLGLLAGWERGVGGIY
jgi:lysophosphatidic acid acyltransferase/lysophosphatidylinositol acyltransferase